MQKQEQDPYPSRDTVSKAIKDAGYEKASQRFITATRVLQSMAMDKRENPTQSKYASRPTSLARPVTTMGSYPIWIGE